MKLRNRVISAGLAALLAGPLALAPAAAIAEPSDLDAASQRLDELGGQLGETQQQLAEAVTELEETDYGVSEKSAQIDATRAELGERQAQLGSEMRSTYKSGSTSLLEFVLGSTSADDLVSRVYYLDKIAKQKADAIQGVRALAEQLEREMAELEERQAAQEELVAALRERVSAYESQVGEARSLYESLDEETRAAVTEQGSANVIAAVEAVETDQAQDALVGQQPSQDASGSNQAPDQAPSDDGAQSEQDGGQQTPPVEQAPEPAPDPQPEPEPQPEPQPEPEPEPEPSQPSAPAGGGVSTALAQVGKPYGYGSAGPDAFDCSGLVCYSYGYALGRDTYAMISSLQGAGRWKTSMDELSYGDLVFPSSGHVGIYLGGGTMVHASRPGVGVVVSSVYSFIGGGSYY